MLFRVLIIFTTVYLAALTCSGHQISTSYQGAIRRAAHGLRAHWQLDDLNTYYQHVVDDIDGQNGLIVGLDTGDWHVGLEDTLAIEGFSMRASTGSPDGYILLPSVPFDNLWNTGSWSLDFWTRFQSLPSPAVESVGCATPFEVSVSLSGELIATFGSTSLTTEAGLIPTGDWAYITVDVTEEGNFTASVNGNLVAQAPLIAVPSSSGCSVAFGRNSAAGTVFDEVVLHNASSSEWYRRSLYDTGIALGCRPYPCFSGVSCTSNGAVSYSCGSCPLGFTGNGETCEVSAALRNSHRLGNCLPAAEDLDNVVYCRDHCRSRRTCFLCGMYYSGPAMWAVRDACYIPSATPSLTTTPSVSPSYTTTASVTSSFSSTVSSTASGTATVSHTSTTTASTSVSHSCTATTTATPSPPSCFDWIQAGADIDGESPLDASGWSVAMNAAGDVVAVGAVGNDGNGDNSGHVRVYRYTGSSWVQKGQDINGEAASDLSGSSVSIDAAGDTVAIGAIDNDGGGQNSGHVRVYRYNGASWVQRGTDINGAAAGDKFGRSVSLNAVGDTVAIGADLGNADNSGQVRVFRFTGANWALKGSAINGEADDDRSGGSVSLNAAGDVVAIGAESNDGTASGSGHVRVFTFTGGNWVQKGADIDGEAGSDASGVSVSINAAGDVVAIGADRNKGAGSDSGHVRVYEFQGGSWVQRGGDIDGEFAGDSSGGSVSLNAAGDVVAIGALENRGNGIRSGHTRVFRYRDDSWEQVGTDIDGEAANDRSGSSVSINAGGDRVAIGAPLNTGSGGFSGHARVYQSVSVPCDP